MGTPVEVITVVGKHSGREIQLDLAAISDMSIWYVKKAPEECRDIKTVTRVIHLNDNMVELLTAETEATQQKIKNIDVDALTEEALRQS